MSEGMNHDVDRYHYHEAMDRAYIQLMSFENALGEHPVLSIEPSAGALYREAHERLFALYQLLGNLSAEQAAPKEGFGDKDNES